MGVYFISATLAPPTTRIAFSQRVRKLAAQSCDSLAGTCVVIAKLTADWRTKGDVQLTEKMFGRWRWGKYTISTGAIHHPYRTIRQRGMTVVAKSKEPLRRRKIGGAEIANKIPKVNGSDESHSTWGRKGCASFAEKFEIIAE
jgi:hypothetical protein